MHQTVRTHINLEMAATEAMKDLALSVRPAVVLLVPEGRQEVTTEGGLDLSQPQPALAGLVQQLQDAGIAISLFIDPEPAAIEAAAKLGVQMVELHTGAFAHAYQQPAARQAAYERLQQAARAAHQMGLQVNAGHGINYTNIKDIRSLPHLKELNIGHSILSRALLSGIEEAVRTMKSLIQG
jgi:pyridoxine 5-phosphate synthase